VLEIFVNFMLAMLSHNMASEVNTAKIIEDGMIPIYFSYRPSLMKV
jgi:hypothetical protein